MIIIIIIMIMKKVMMAHKFSCHIAPSSQCCFGHMGVFLHLFLSPQNVWSTFVTPPPCWWVTQLLQEWASDHDFFQPFLYFVIFCGILCLSYVATYNLTVVGMSWWPRIFQPFWIFWYIFLFLTFIPVKKYSRAIAMSSVQIVFLILVHFGPLDLGVLCCYGDF